LLLSQHQHGRIVLRLAQRFTFQSKGGAAAVGLRQPARARKAANGGGGEGFQL
jgi:hypothetical protein